MLAQKRVSTGPGQPDAAEVPDNQPNWGMIDSFRANSASPALYRFRPCPICGSLRERAFIHVERFQFFSDSSEWPKQMPVRHVTCEDCLALFMNPCPTGQGYGVLFAEGGRSFGASPGRYAEQARWLQNCGLLSEGRRVLDAGCYEGALLASLPDHIHRMGVDIDTGAIERARSRFVGKSAEFICADFESFETKSRPDTILMLHVLEHLPNPVLVLRNLRSISHEDSHLVVEVPVVEYAPTNDVNGHFGVFHVTHFSRTSLGNALARAGWQILDEELMTYNGLRVIATPSPEREALSSCGQDLVARDKQMVGWHAAMASVEEKLGSVSSEHLVIWGAGIHLEMLYQFTGLFLTFPNRRYLVVDADPVKQGTTWRGLRIHDPEVLRSIDWDEAKLVVSSYGSQENIASAALQLGVPENGIVKLYDWLRVY